MRGEDYCFQFSGKLRDGKLHFRLHMQWEGDGDGEGGGGGGGAEGPEGGCSKTIDFVYDPDSDTPGGWVLGQGGGSGCWGVGAELGVLPCCHSLKQMVLPCGGAARCQCA